MFFKLFWYLSVMVLFLFNVADSYRVYDYLRARYSIQKMNTTEVSYGSTAKGRSVMVRGDINGAKVYFGKSDDDIAEIRDLYPEVFYEKNARIAVLKFEHSRDVMTIKDDEFAKWKKFMLISNLYVFGSLCYFIFRYFKKKSMKVFDLIEK